MVKPDINTANFHLANLIDSLQKFEWPNKDDETTILLPEDKLILHKIRDALNTKFIQLQERYEAMDKKRDQLDRELEDMESFVNELEGSVATLDEILSN